LSAPNDQQSETTATAALPTGEDSSGDKSLQSQQDNGLTIAWQYSKYLPSAGTN
jgi:hypothetical protein